MRKILIIVCILGLALPVLADTFTDDFEGGTNHGAWYWQNWGDVIEPAGGNPDGWLHDSMVFAFPTLLTGGHDNANFCGNYVAAGVTRISGDFQTIYSEGQPESTPFCVFLRNTMGTPDDLGDDVYVYTDPNLLLCPQIGDGWTHYDFDIPSDWTGPDGTLPPGWMGGSASWLPDLFPADMNWHDILSSVNQVEFWLWHPAYGGFGSMWDVGADNITIEYDMAPVANEEASWGSVKDLYR